MEADNAGLKRKPMKGIKSNLSFDHFLPNRNFGCVTPIVQLDANNSLKLANKLLTVTNLETPI